MPVCYCKTGGYGKFLQVVEQKPVQQKPVQQKVEECQETEPDKRMTKRKLRQLEPLKPSKREKRVRCVETGMEFATIKQAGAALAALGLGKDATVAAAAITNCIRTGGTAYGFHFVKVAPETMKRKESKC